MLRKFHICPNAYYNYRKQRKAEYNKKKQQALEEIQNIYHQHHGVDGYRSMRIYLERKGISLSSVTVHKYMNKELGLYSIVRRKSPCYKKGSTHKVCPNYLEQNFKAEERNQKWATDFTYLFLKDGKNAIIVPLLIYMTEV